MLTVATTGTREVSRQLRGVTDAMPEQIDAGLTEVGRIVQSEAKIRANISPTKGQAKAAGISVKKNRAPGTLTNAIVMVKKRGQVIVGVLRGAALKYAEYIHNGQGTRWQKIGPGSKAKQRGPRVGGEFLTRAYDDNEDELQKTYEAEIAKALP
jgi:hypothetical protein